MDTWNLLTDFGDCAVLLPMVLITVAWLLSRPSTRHNGLLWAATVLACGGIVALSKLVYMAWGVGLPGLDFIGFSGHTALSCVVWPALPALLVPPRHRQLRRALVAAGVVLALGIACSRLSLGAHSISEVVLGALLGLGLTALFLSLRQHTARLGVPVWQVGASLLVALLLCYGRTFPANHLLKDTALFVSGHGAIFDRHAEAWQEPAGNSRG